MKDIGNDCYLDSAGQLYITRPVPPDPFDPPGTQPPDVLVATGYTYEDIPTYGWPLGIVYQNDPIQFATDRTARQMLARAISAAPSARWYLSLDEAKVGPFRRAVIRLIAARTDEGRLVKLNAGELAARAAKYPASWAAGLAVELRGGGSPSDEGDTLP